MKYFSTSLCAAALALTAGTAMAADATPSTIVEGPYITGGLVRNWVYASDVDLCCTSVTSKFKPGWGFLAAVGYEWANGFRGELEVSHRENNGNYLNPGSMPLLGTQRDTAMMANVVKDFDTGTRFTPYAGAGIGVDWVKWSNVHTATSPVFAGGRDKVAWQVLAGVSYALDTNVKLVAEFHYLGSPKHNFAGTGGTTAHGYENDTPQIMLGVRYSFGSAPKHEEAAAAPAPTPAPVRAPAPPAPPVPQKFLVFFDFDKSNLRGDAQKIVSEAVDYAKTNGKATIVATGHADTSGSDAYNMALSERRAKTVEKELERLGIPAKEVVVRWKGESEPLIQTGDGVKEPQNRRVEIVLE